MRLKLPASSGAKASGCMWPSSDATRRSGTSGAAARLTPKPRMTRSPPRSSRMPASFLPASIKSLGHLSINGSSETATSSASIRASPAASESVCAGGSFGRSRTSVLPWKLPAADTHSRPCRPLPASCCNATSQSPSAAFSFGKQVGVGRAGALDDADSSSEERPRRTVGDRAERADQQIAERRHDERGDEDQAALDRLAHACVGRRPARRSTSS